MWVARGIVAPVSRAEQFSLGIERAVENGTITDDEQGRLAETDMIARATRIADEAEVWIAAEASGVINDIDISRSRESATALAKLYRTEAIAAVYGYQIADAQRQRAEAGDELQEALIFLEI